jgi:hypothetical protein
MGSGPPDKSELLNTTGMSPTEVQAQLDSYGAQGYHGPYTTFTLDGVQFIYVGGYVS